MAGTKKRLKKMAAKVAAILGDETKAKKLKKAKALSRFIAKMEEKQKDLQSRLSKGALETREAKETGKKARKLAKQITKAKAILAEILETENLPDDAVES